MMRKNPSIVPRQIHGAFFLIDISDNFANNCCALYELNETGMFLWNHITESSNKACLARELQAAIIDTVDYKIIYDDVSSYVDTLIANGFVLEV